MPLKIVPPRKGKSPNYSIRGTYLGIHVDRSTGTNRRGVAVQQLRKIERQIERGEFEKRPDPAAPTFLTAAVKYMRANDPKPEMSKHIGVLIRHFGETPLDAIDQAAIDDAAVSLYPDVGAATRNVYVYMPLSAVLRSAGRREPIKRPKGALGRVVTDYLTEADASGIILAAESFDREFALLLKFLLYTGCRLGEALGLRPEHLDLDRGAAWVSRSKTGVPKTLRLRADLIDALRGHMAGKPVRVFRFRQGGHLHHMLNRAKLRYLGLACPSRRPAKWTVPPHRLAFANFHTFRHTWATWMRRYAGADVQGLVATGNWSSHRSAMRYTHVVARDEWARTDLLPSIKKQAI